MLPPAIRFSLDLEVAEPTLRCDPNQIQQALLNLILNASDAMPQGGVISIKTEILSKGRFQSLFSQGQDSPYVCISVQDTGDGFDDAAEKRLFEPLTAIKKDGTGGMGLAVTQSIVTDQGGFLQAKGRKVKGTSVQMYFPLLEEESSLRSSAPMEREELQDRKETVLLVEDEGMLRELIKTFLEEKGLRVRTAADGLKAVELYRRYKNRISVVVMDLGLPELSGWEAFWKIKSSDPAAKVIFASGYLDPELRAELFRAGAKAFIPKPYSPHEMLKKINQVIKQREKPILKTSSKKEPARGRASGKTPLARVKSGA